MDKRKKKKNVNSDWIDNKIKFWMSNNNSIVEILYDTFEINETQIQIFFLKRTH